MHLMSMAFPDLSVNCIFRLIFAKVIDTVLYQFCNHTLFYTTELSPFE